MSPHKLTIKFNKRIQQDEPIIKKNLTHQISYIDFNRKLIHMDLKRTRRLIENNVFKYKNSLYNVWQ